MKPIFPLTIIRLTPSGRGAVASFLLCGEGAIDVFRLYWQGKKNLDNLPRYGRLQLNDAGDCEEAVACQTAEGAIEIHVHGGEQIALAIETLFERHGATRKTWQEHFTNGASQQDFALRMLPFAPTERTAQILLDQYNGAFDREMSAIERLSDPEEKLQRLLRLQERSQLGTHLIEPFRVVLAGASNAGKSSLLNAILGFQRSIVHSLPGTTRDVVSGQTALDGFPVTFLDTAGFRETDNGLELQGMDRSLRSLANADLVVWVIDLTVEESQCPVPDLPEGLRPPLLCYNKIDLVGIPAHSVGTPVSALTGEGIETLLDEVIRRLVPYPPKPGEAVPIGDILGLIPVVIP